MLINTIRSYSAEFGLIAPLGARKADDLTEDLRSADEAILPDMARTALLALAGQLALLADEICRLERR